MPNNVLVPLDGSDHSYGGVEYALRSFPDAAITTFHVVSVDREWDRGGPGVVESWTDRGRAAGDRYHEAAKDRAARVGREIDVETVVGVPHKAILEFVVEEEVDHVVMGSHGRSPITRPFVGHVTEAVTKRSPVPVTVVPEPADELESRSLPGRILVPLDGSDGALAALTFTIEQFPDAEITALHAIDLGIDYVPEEISGTYVERLYDQLLDRGDDILTEARERAESLDRDLETVTTVGKPTTAIVEHAVQNDFDQIVIGSRGRSRLGRHLLGSVAEAVVQRSPIPTTLVREIEN